MRFFPPSEFVFPADFGHSGVQNSLTAVKGGCSRGEGPFCFSIELVSPVHSDSACMHGVTQEVPLPFFGFLPH